MARGQWSLFSFNHCVPDMAHGNCLAAGGYPCSLICSVSPLSSHGSLRVAGALMAFKCLTHAHNTGWPSSQLERRQRRDPHPFGRQLLGHSEQWGLCNTPEGNPGHSSSVASTALDCLQRVPMRKEVREEAPRSLYGPPKMSWSKRGLEKNFQTIDRREGNKVY